MSSTTLIRPEQLQRQQDICHQIQAYWQAQQRQH